MHRHALTLLLCLVAPVVSAEPKTSNAPFLTPEQAVAKMSIPEGFAVSVYASEPDLAEPIAFCFDDKGRMWVAQNLNYQTRGRHTDEEVSRIDIFDDTDGDGVFDRKVTFKDDLTFISGLAVGRGGVFVGTPPTLSFIPDTDGDDVPDTEPEVLLDGWGINDRHETLNSFLWGPDGWLYGAHGVFTRSKVGRPGEADETRQFIDGGIWRYHPERKRFEIVVRGLSNPWGFDFNDEGQLFATCCVIPHLFHLTPGGIYHKQSRPHVNPHVYDDIKTIRDHTHKSAHGGARFYLAEAFPERYRRRLFMCNIHQHSVLTDIMIPSRSGYVGRHGDDFLPTNDLAWVGFSVEIGPEGGVYILDWHDTDICGNAINFPDSGRIYRIMPEGAQPTKRPNLRSLSDLQLAKLQASRSDWHVRHARLLLRERHLAGTLDRERVRAELARQFSSALDSGRRLRALWAAFGIDGFAGEHRDALVELLRHSDEHVRAWAVRLLVDRSNIDAFRSSESPAAPDSESSPLTKHELQLITFMGGHDPSEVVRLAVASASMRLPFSERWPILRGLAARADDADDPNLPRMIWFALEPMVTSDPTAALELAAASRMPQLSEFVARRLVSDAAIPSPKRAAADAKRTIQKVAAGFDVSRVGEGGVVWHSEFRNKVAVQTHPQNRSTASRLTRRVSVPQDKRTTLALTVSHHPHGDWQLRVLVDGKLHDETIVGPKTTTDEWLTREVDLTSFAGRTIELVLENKANDWRNEWAYWHSVTITSE